jgi:ligand-binding sensor domain-containing protein
LLDNEVDSVVIDNSNGVWCGSDQGVNYYNGKSWQSFTAADGLVGSWVTQIIKDQSGNIWLTAFGGISRYTFAK